MRYIQKKITPQFFIEDTKELQNKIIGFLNKKDKKLVWDNDYKDRRKLKEYILENEQNYLCCYCEAKVTLDNSHVEHIRPKDMNEDSLTFDYNNLSVSCNGTCFNDKNQRLTCGHKKSNKFDENKFLNPTQVVDIREYFIYTDNYYIGASNKDTTKATYTMKLLQLNSFNNYLPEARKIALDDFNSSIKEHRNKTGKDTKYIIKELLKRENLAFISFLRFRYKAIL